MGGSVSDCFLELMRLVNGILVKQAECNVLGTSDARMTSSCRPNLIESHVQEAELPEMLVPALGKP